LTGFFVGGAGVLAGLAAVFLRPSEELRKARNTRIGEADSASSRALRVLAHLRRMSEPGPLYTGPRTRHEEGGLPVLAAVVFRSSDELRKARNTRIGEADSASSRALRVLAHLRRMSEARTAIQKTQHPSYFILHPSYLTLPPSSLPRWSSTQAWMDSSTQLAFCWGLAKLPREISI
jgi:hypothetical protein